MKGNAEAASNTTPFSTCGRNAVAIPINRSDAPPKTNNAKATLDAFLALTSLFWSCVICDMFILGIPEYFNLIGNTFMVYQL